MSTAATPLQPLRPVLARCLPFALYILSLAFAAWLTGMHPGVNGQNGLTSGLQFDMRWLYAVQISCVVAALVFFRRDYVELGAASPMRLADWGMSLLVGVGVFVLWINLDSGWVTLRQARAGFVPLDNAGGLDWPLVVVRIVGAAIVVPVMEELFWRSFVQRWIDRQDFLAVAPSEVSLRALLLASAAFGFEHGQWLAGIVAGLAYGYLYRRSGSLWPPVAAHGVTNFLLGIWVVSTGQWHFW